MAHAEGQAGNSTPLSGSSGWLYDNRFLAALLVLGLGLTTIGAWLLLPRDSHGIPLGGSLPGNNGTLPTDAGLLVAIPVVVVLALLLGTLAGRRKRARVMAAAATVGLVLTGISAIAPPAIQQIPGEINNTLQAMLAQPEPGYPRIKVPSVGIDLLLVMGDGKTPPVRYEAFTYPGADHLLTGSQAGGGNSYIYAHARRGMFGALHKVRRGDVIQVDYGSGRILRYAVSDVHPGVKWTDLSWLRPTADDRLTLQTCNGWNDGDPRFIVVAHRIEGNTG